MFPAKKKATLLQSVSVSHKRHNEQGATQCCQAFLVFVLFESFFIDCFFGTKNLAFFSKICPFLFWVKNQRFFPVLSELCPKLYCISLKMFRRYFSCFRFFFFFFLQLCLKQMICMVGKSFLRFLKFCQKVLSFLFLFVFCFVLFCFLLKGHAILLFSSF